MTAKKSNFHNELSICGCIILKGVESDRRRSKKGLCKNKARKV